MLVGAVKPSSAVARCGSQVHHWQRASRIFSREMMPGLPVIRETISAQAPTVWAIGIGTLTTRGVRPTIFAAASPNSLHDSGFGCERKYVRPAARGLRAAAR